MGITTEQKQFKSTTFEKIPVGTIFISSEIGNRLFIKTENVFDEYDDDDAFTGIYYNGEAVNLKTGEIFILNGNSKVFVPTDVICLKNKEIQ